MPKITDEELVVIQVRIFKEDHTKLKKYFGQDLGVNKAIRTWVRTWVKQLDARANDRIDQLEGEAEGPKPPNA